MPVTITTRVDDELVKLIDRIAKKEGMDRSTIIRRFLMGSTAEWLIEKSLEEYEEGKISLWKAAKKCDLSLWEIIEEARNRRIHVPYTMEDLKEDLENIS
jgi:predicted HTH domain antitoxin